MVETILAVGAHPDDFEIGCGGTIKRLINRGAKVYGLVLTRGQNGEHAVDCHECNGSANYLGLKKLMILDFMDGKIRDDCDVVSAIRNIVKEYEPERLYVHSFKDTHQDHRNAYHATISAAKRLVPNIFMYQSPSTEPGFLPVEFSIITDTLEEKIKAIEHYQTQIEKSTVVDIGWIRAQAVYWGDKARTNGEYCKNMDLAEAFEVYRRVEK